jgi:hypothetical protein
MDKSKVKKYRNYSIAIIVAVVVITGGIFGYRYLKRITTPPENAVKAIPLSSSCVIEFKNIQSLWESVSSKNKMWKALTKLSFFADLDRTYRNIDSVCIIDKDVKEVISSQKFYISMHKQDSGSFNFLYVLQLNSCDMESTAVDIIKKATGKNYKIANEKINEFKVYSVKSARNADILSFYCAKGIFAASKSKLLVEESLNGLIKNQSIADNKYYTKLAEVAGKNVDANIYINTSDFGGLIADFANPDYIDIAGFVKNFTNWIELDLNLKDDEILLSGYTIPNLSEYFIECFATQTPQQVEISKVIPYNTELMIFMGFSDFKKYNFDRFEYLNLPQAIVNISDTSSTEDISDTASVKSLFTNYTGSEIAFIKADYLPDKYSSDIFAVIRINNIDRMKMLLSNVSEKPVDSAKSNKIYVNRLKSNFAVSELYGGVFDSIINNYYIIIDEYLIFGNDPESLSLYALNCQSGKTLNANVNYKAFSEKMSGKANLFLYVNARKASDVYKRFLDYDLASELNLNYNVLKDFEAFGIQFSKENNGFYSNIFLKYNEKYSEENSAVWEARLDTTALSKPYLINVSDTSDIIAVFDVRNSLYLFNLYGEKICKTRIGEKPLSRVYKVTFEGKPFLVFNTSESLYAVDLNGKIRRGSPVKLPFRASAGMVLSGEGKDSKVIFPTTNKKVYKINMEGKTDKGWQIVNMLNNISANIQQIYIKGKEFNFITDREGVFQITDKNGKSLIKPKQNFKKSSNSLFYPVFNRSVLYGFTTSDKTGNIFIIKPDGTSEKIVNNRFSSENIFVLPDAERSSTSFSYIIIDKNLAYIYGIDKKMKCKLVLGFSPDLAEINFMGNSAILSSPDFANFIEISDCETAEFPFIKGSKGVEFAGGFFGQNYILTSSENYLYCFVIDTKNHK